jgi:hypothetical protein
MAYVVARRARGTSAIVRPERADRFEIRESVATDRGPRARSLATFAVLDEEVLGRARARALRPFVDGQVVSSARRLGAPVAVEEPVERWARALLGELNAGRRPSPVLGALLQTALGPPTEIDDNVHAAAQWIGAGDERRGRALAELLELADVLPIRRRPDRSTFPRIVSDA